MRLLASILILALAGGVCSCGIRQGIGDGFTCSIPLASLCDAYYSANGHWPDRMAELSDWAAANGRAFDPKAFGVTRFCEAGDKLHVRWTKGGGGLFSTVTGGEFVLTIPTSHPATQPNPATRAA
jgi:hypothetical protein